MNKLTIITFGTQNFIDRYSKPLIEDCKKLGYNIHVGVIPQQTHISHINCTILKHIIEYVKRSNTRICIMDPECRIIKPIPTEWINTDYPVIFQKNYYIGKAYQYNEEMPCTFIGQPLLCSNKDLNWMQWWYDAVISMEHEGIYPPNESMLVMSLKFNKVKTITKTISYDRSYQGSYECVKGNWTNNNVIIQHPSLHGVLDNDMLPPHDWNRQNSVLQIQKLHNHFNNYNTIKKIDELMLKEKTDIKDWPKETLPVRINTTNWFRVEDWLFSPGTGQVKNINFDSIKYHYSIDWKIDKGIKTPVTNSFSHDKDLV